MLNVAMKDVSFVDIDHQRILRVNVMKLYLVRVYVYVSSKLTKRTICLNEEFRIGLLRIQIRFEFFKQVF